VEEEAHLLSEPLEYLVRHEAAKLLHEGPPGRFLCLTCLEKALRSGLGAAHTKGRVERALRTMCGRWLQGE